MKAIGKYEGISNSQVTLILYISMYENNNPENHLYPFSLKLNAFPLTQGSIGMEEIFVNQDEHRALGECVLLF